MQIYRFETLTSTNQTLWDLIHQGAAPGTVVIAAQQTGGRGQWGRHWQSGMGGLYLSLALAPNLPATDGGQLTLCSAWGIATALRDSGIPVGIKWPNDLILQQRKLGGILTETRVHQNQITKAVVGVGINWANPVPETGINLQSFLANHPTPLITSLEMLIEIVLKGLVAAFEALECQGFTSFLPAYETLLINMGHRISLGQQSGVIVGVAPTGELRVRLPSDRFPRDDTDKNHAASAIILLQPGTISLGYGAG